MLCSWLMGRESMRDTLSLPSIYPQLDNSMKLTPPSVVRARRLKEHLRQKLIDSGWRDQLKEYTMGAYGLPSPAQRWRCTRV